MGTICSQPRESAHDAAPASGSFLFNQTYRNVSFENTSGDICSQKVDAIINAANNQLAHNNGLANSIVVKGGQVIQEESDKFMDNTDGILDVGAVVVTSAGHLPAKHVIHVVSPIWNGGENEEEKKLALAVKNALEKANEHKVQTLAVPCLSAGGFGFPKEKCAEIIVKNCLEYLDNNPNTTLKLIRFVNMDAPTVRAFKAELERCLKDFRDSIKKSFKEETSIQENHELEKSDHSHFEHKPAVVERPSDADKPKNEQAEDTFRKESHDSVHEEKQRQEEHHHQNHNHVHEQPHEQAHAHEHEHEHAHRLIHPVHEEEVVLEGSPLEAGSAPSE